MSEPRSVGELTAIVVNAVVQHYGISADQIYSRQRTVPIAWARQVAVTLVSEFTGEMESSVAGHFRLDHTTVGYSLRKVAQTIECQPRVAAEISTIRAAIETAAPETRDRADPAIAPWRRPLSDGDEPMPTDVSRELSVFLGLLNRSLRAALQRDPAALLVGIKRASDQVNAGRGK